MPKLSELTGSEILPGMTNDLGVCNEYFNGANQTVKYFRELSVELDEENIKIIVGDVYYDACGEKVNQGELHRRVAKALVANTAKILRLSK